jgi:hypothetical protein
MVRNRDDFTKRTVDILGKRVGFLCSNPTCRKFPIGPHEEADKATIIGIAAHITAASPDGPRFDSELTDEQRSHIDNGIWLCCNCATLIDKDFTKYPVVELHKWKSDAEAELYRRLQGVVIFTDDFSKVPFIEADIIWTHGGRWNRGFSPRNKGSIITGHDLPIIFWELNWNFTITLYNNSKVDAFNIQIESIGKVHFNALSKLKKINLLPSLQNIDINADFKEYIEGTHIEADKLLKDKIPQKTNGLCLRISYLDDTRQKTISTLAYIVDGQFINKREL